MERQSSRTVGGMRGDVRESVWRCLSAPVCGLASCLALTCLDPSSKISQMSCLGERTAVFAGWETADQALMDGVRLLRLRQRSALAR